MIGYLVYFFIIYDKHKSVLYKIMLGLFITAMAFYSPVNGLDIISRTLFEMVRTYKLLGIANLLIIPVAIYCSPNKLNSKYQVFVS